MYSVFSISRRFFYCIARVNAMGGPVHHLVVHIYVGYLCALQGSNATTYA